MRSLLILLAALAATGCVSTRPAPVDTPEGRAAVNERAARGAAMLYLDGEPVRAVRNLRVDAVEATWTDRLTGAPASAPTARVRAVAFGAGGRSILRGAAIGAATGLALGTVGVLAEGTCSGWVCFTPGFVIGTYTVSGGLIGVGVGAAQRARLDARPQP